MIIYLIRNLINGKVYIGKTKGTLATRWKTHLLDAEKGSKLAFHRAIRKYSAAAFSPEILAEVLTSQELIDQERAFIALYHSYPPSLGFGYNLSSGGEGGPEIVKKKHSSASRRKMSEAKKRNPPTWLKRGQSGTVFSKQWRQRLGDHQRGSKNCNFGRTWKDSEETRAKKRAVIREHDPITGRFIKHAIL